MIDQTKAHAPVTSPLPDLASVAVAGDDLGERRFAEEQRASSRSGGVHAFRRAYIPIGDIRTSFVDFISDRDSSTGVDDAVIRGIIIPRGMQIHRKSLA